MQGLAWPVGRPHRLRSCHAVTEGPALSKYERRRRDLEAKDVLHRQRLRETVASRPAADATVGTGLATDASALELILLQGARTVNTAQALWSQVIRQGDTVVDATCGHGRDTLALAGMVGSTGRVYALDIQEEAADLTRTHLEEHLHPEDLPQLHVVSACHSRLQEVVGSMQARVVAFNLGYLPGADKSVVTRLATTVSAIEAAMEVVIPGGLITVCCYRGHDGGREEMEEVVAMAEDLAPAHWISASMQLRNRPTAPMIVMFWRRSDTGRV